MPEKIHHYWCSNFGFNSAIFFLFLPLRDEHPIRAIVVGDMKGVSAFTMLTAEQNDHSVTIIEMSADDLLSLDSNQSGKIIKEYILNYSLKYPISELHLSHFGRKFEMLLPIFVANIVSNLIEYDKFLQIVV